MNRSLLLIALAFAVAQILVIACGLNGPFVDEGIYAVAGVRLLQGLPGDNTWLGGSPYLFPLLSGCAFKLFGLTGCRLAAAALCTGALFYFQRFAQFLFGRTASSWATALLASNGIFFAMAHLAVYDALAFFGFCAWLGSYAKLCEAPGWRNAIVWGLFGLLTVSAKYFAAVPVVACVPIALALPRKPALKYVAAGAAVVALILPLLRLTQGTWLPLSAIHAVGEQSLIRRDTLVFQIGYFGGAALVLAVLGGLVLGRRYMPLLAAMLLASLAWPGIQLLLGSHVSLHKHVAYGFALLYPIGGAGLAALWRSRPLAPPLILAPAMAWGAFQAYVQDRAWADIRPLVQTLRLHVAPGDEVAFEWGWSLSLFLAVDGPLNSPKDVVDQYELLRKDKDRLCELPWIVSVEGEGHEADPNFRAARRCGFEAVDRLPAQIWYVLPPFPSTALWDFVIYARPSAEKVSG